MTMVSSYDTLSLVSYYDFDQNNNLTATDIHGVHDLMNISLSSCSGQVAFVKNGLFGLGYNFTSRNQRCRYNATMPEISNTSTNSFTINLWTYRYNNDTSS